MDIDQLLKSDLAGNLIGYGIKTLGVLIAIWFSFRLGAWIERRVQTGLQSRKFDTTLSVFFGSLSRWLLITAAVLACLGVFGIQTTSFAALLGAAGLAVGLAFQGTLSNFAAGVMLLTFRPFGVGDYIITGGKEGYVAEVGLFVTSIDTLDSRRIVIPNSAIIAGEIENVSHHEFRRADVPVGVAYAEDIDKVREALMAAAKAVEGVTDKKEPEIFMKALGASSVDFEVRVWCRPDDFWAVWDRTMESIKRHLDEREISIPFPQLDMHVRDVASDVFAPLSAAKSAGAKSTATVEYGR